jgi:hypothetical protein
MRGVRQSAVPTPRLTPTRLRLRDHTARAQEAGVVSAAEAASWLRAVEQADHAGQFFAALTFFFVSGRKP